MIDFAMKELIALLNEIKPQYGAVGSRDVDVTAQRKRIDEAIAMLKKMSAVSPEQTNILGYFSFDPDDGAEILKDRQTAIDNCNASIDLYRESMQEEYQDGWSDDVKRVCWGVILQEARGFDAQGIPEDDPSHTYQTINYRLAPELAELQTVKLAPHVYRQLVNDLRDVALEYHSAQQLRERISRALSKAVTAAHPHLEQPVSNPYKLISVKDDTPTESGDYWCYLGKDFESPTKYRVVHFDVRHHEFQDHRVTHWMRLPAEPEQEA